MTDRARMRLPAGGGRWIGIGPSTALAEATADLEPSSTLAAAALRASSGLQVVLRVEDRRGSVLGAVVLRRLGTAQWDALPLVVDPLGNDLLARLTAWSPASAILGIGPHVAPLVEHIRRARSVGRSPFFGSADLDATPPTDLDPRTRMAALADVAALTELFAGSYQLSRPPDLRSWRRSLRQAIIDGFAVVAEVDGRVVGGLLMGAASEDWVFGTDTVVHPDHRGEGLSWAMTNRAFALVTIHGLMMCGAKVDENPMDVDRHFVGHGALSGELWGVALDPHLRWPSVRWRRRQARRIDRWTSVARATASGLVVGRTRARWA